MFESFFPKPRVFILSLLGWVSFCVIVWYTLGGRIGALLGFPFHGDAQPIIGLGYFFSPEFILFYIYFAFVVLIFSALWFVFSPHRWQWWSIVGSALILFSTYFSVQVAVAINNWRRPFFDAVQDALSGNSVTTASDLYGLILIFAQIAFLWMGIFVLTRFFVSHYIFRWRTAMNDYYVARWGQLRHIEGASQRIQEDTMRFASIMEGLGVSLVDSVMTLFAFLPVLFSLSVYVSYLPIFGEIWAPLFLASIFWSIFGTVLLAAVGMKLPGLEFRNQRVEAAYRKELVYGEDDTTRAMPPTLANLFGNVRRNYFRLYFHYMYFNVARGFYIQADNIFAYYILIPTIAAGAITFGILQQILTAFSQVSNSFQYLVNSWTTIVEFLSIYKRLKAFESTIHGGTLPEDDREYFEKGGNVEE